MLRIICSVGAGTGMSAPSVRDIGYWWPTDPNLPQSSTHNRLHHRRLHFVTKHADLAENILSKLSLDGVVSCWQNLLQMQNVGLILIEVEWRLKVLWVEELFSATFTTNEANNQPTNDNLWRKRGLEVLDKSSQTCSKRDRKESSGCIWYLFRERLCFSWWSTHQWANCRSPLSD